MIRRTWIASIACLLFVLYGCAAETVVNPSFPITITKARGVLAYDKAHPRPLKRPLLIVGGFFDPGFATAALSDEFGWWTGDKRIISVPLFWVSDFDQCRSRIIDCVQKAYPSDDPMQTTEVDVVGISMGGLAAVYAAADIPGHGRRLDIGRLFTISSPLRGALLASDIPLNLHPLQGYMRPGSPFLTKLYEMPPGNYSVYSYTRLNDLYVGTYNAALPGRTPWWVQPPPFDSPHSGCYRDARILADIACRLRGDPPLAHDPPAPLPTAATASTSTR
jgi:pimeloyl-ACP methyl ester carboxylesterase